jgi:membrane protein required for beta-lactamase induction
MIVIRVVLGAMPGVMVLVGLLSPAINGPHLWFGLPSFLVWICICTIACTAVLLSYEATRGSSP